MKPADQDPHCLPFLQLGMLQVNWIKMRGGEGGLFSSSPLLIPIFFLIDLFKVKQEYSF